MYVDRVGEVCGGDFAGEVMLHSSARQREVERERYEGVSGAEPLETDVADEAAEPSSFAWTTFWVIFGRVAATKPPKDFVGSLTVPVGRDAEPAAVLRDAHPAEFVMRRRGNDRVLTGSSARGEEHESDRP